MSLHRPAILAIAALALAACPGRAPEPVDAAQPDTARSDAPAPVDSSAPDTVVLDASDASADALDANVPADAPGADAPARDGATDAATGPAFCTLGGAALDITLPSGFCARRFATVGAPRVIAFAPNGDLFVAAPSSSTPGGAPPGDGSIRVYTDDDHDGVGESHIFVDGLFDVHGLAFGPGVLYFTTSDTVWRVPYANGDRAASAPPATVGHFTTGGVPMRWTHGLARSVDGTLYATQGNYGSASCPPSMMDGAINALPSGSSAMTTVAYGFRNPMYIRCHPSVNVCLASELSDDSDSFGAPEKVVVVRPGSMYGYPCCITNSVNSQYNADGSRYTCSGVQPAAATVPLHDTPFGLDWAPDSWPDPYRNALFIALHGSAYHPGWRGASLQFASTSALTGTPDSAFQNFIAYDGRGTALRRPTDVAFAPDGRLFLSDDAGGQIFWIAPATLRASR